MNVLVIGATGGTGPVRARGNTSSLTDWEGCQATIHDVCAACNNRLGKNPDQEFLRNTHIALLRFFDPALTKGQASAPQFVQFEHGFFDIRLLNTGEMDILPQIAAIPTGVLVCADGDDQGLADSVLAEFKDGAPVVRRVIRDVAEHDPPRGGNAGAGGASSGGYAGSGGEARN